MAAASLSLQRDVKRIVLGVACETCGIVYLPHKAAGVQIDPMPSRMGPGMFFLKCSACGRIRSFHQSDLKLYTVSADSYTRGHAKRGEYNLRPKLAQCGA
jgi:RNase P subunit RPR2